MFFIKNWTQLIERNAPDRPAKTPQNAKEIGHFDFSQEETLSLGQTETDGNLYEVCKITLYDGSFIDFEIAGLRMSFEVTRDTADYLTGLLTQ